MRLRPNPLKDGRESRCFAARPCFLRCRGAVSMLVSRAPFMRYLGRLANRFFAFSVPPLPKTGDLMYLRNVTVAKWFGRSAGGDPASYAIRDRFSHGDRRLTCLSAMIITSCTLSLVHWHLLPTPVKSHHRPSQSCIQGPHSGPTTIRSTTCRCHSK
jgi:hypothetical protein